ncbi:MAG: hypothetical protein ACRDMZ_20245, partial [Solirubrobacteraceae bacterium]
MSRRSWLMPVFALFITSGCATIVRGTHQSVHFESLPAGALLLDKGTGQTWQTPVDVALPRNGRHALVISLDGYEP